MQNRSNLFQNENMTVNKISPSHILYRPSAYDDGGYSNDYNEVNKNNYQEKNLITEPNINHFPENDINQRIPNSGNSENNVSIVIYMDLEKLMKKGINII